MNTYYVSNLGNDALDGLTPETAWATIQKVNASIKAGDEVRFKCGDTFYGHVAPPAGTAETGYTTYTSYGEGEKPTISQYKIPTKGAWEAVDGLWRLDLKDTSKFTGNTSELNTNVGFIKVDGEVIGRKRFDFGKIVEEWDFINDDQYVWVKCEKNPEDAAELIEIACQIGCIRFANWIAVKNIIIRGTGAHGISGTVDTAYIANCEFHEIGGSQLPGYPTPNTRYGNGVECWANSKNVTVEFCRFSGIYDVAITMQGQPVKTSWTNMHFNDNVMWNCQQCFEIWSNGDVPDTGFEDCWFERNVCIDSAYCWGYDVRPNKDCSSHLLIYGLGCPKCDITVRGNTFKNARVATLYKSGGPKEVPDDYKIYDNVIIIPKGQDICFAAKNDQATVDAFNEKIRKTNRVVEV